MPTCSPFFKHLLAWRSYVIAILAPSTLSLLFLYDGTQYQSQARCTFVLMLLVVFWTSECIPIAITALFPMFLYPLLKIATAKELAPHYMSEVIMSFMGSYIMVIAFERANLHKRLALRILLIVGPQPRWLLFGTMMSACLLSMFTNNAVTCALHLPIVKGIIDELREASEKQSKNHAKSNGSNGDVAAGLSVVESTATFVVNLDDLSSEEPATSDSQNSEPQSSSNDDEMTTEIDGGGGQQKESEPIKEPPVDEQVAVESNNNDGNNVKQDKPSLSIVVSRTPGSDDAAGDDALSPKTITNLEKMLLIAAAYSSSIGGMCTLIGTPTNLIMKERVDEVFKSYNCTQEVTFMSWMVYGVPVGYSFILVAWFWLQFYFLGPKYLYRVWINEPFRCFFKTESQSMVRAKLKAERQAERVSAVIHQLHAQLEPMGFHQYAVLAHCVVLVGLLITRQMSTGESHDYIGWGIVAPGYVEESTAAMLVTASVFIFPSSWPSHFMTPGSRPPQPLLKWSHVEEAFPFGVILLLGGGMAATYGAQKSGLPMLIAPFFHDFIEEIPLGFAVLVTSIFVATMTEVMSNVACVTLMSPIMEELAFELHVNPLLFLFPTAISASFAFMLPVATLPNALVFSTNRLKIMDMVLCGVGMNIIGILVVWLATNTWGDAYFSLFSPPCSAGP